MDTPNPHPETKRTEILACSILFIIILLICVPLRFYARKVAGVGFWWDDWLCLAGLPFALTVPIIDIINSQHSMGWHMADISPADVERYGYLLYIVLLFYNPGLIFFKFTLLVFYVRVFPVIKYFRTAAYILTPLIILWFLGTQMAFVFRCYPISAAWTGQGKCINQANVYIAQSVPTLVFDLVILALPVHTIWSAQLRSSKRVAVICVFLLGGLVTIISIVRLSSTLTSTDEDITYGYVDLGIWSAAEPVIGLLGCCLLTYGPLVGAFRRKFGLTVAGRSENNSKVTPFSRHDAREVGTFRSTVGYSRHRDSDTFELNDAKQNASPPTGTHCESAGSATGDLEMGKDSIYVRHDISVVR